MTLCFIVQFEKDNIIDGGVKQMIFIVFTELPRTEDKTPFGFDDMFNSSFWPHFMNVQWAKGMNGEYIHHHLNK